MEFIDFCPVCFSKNIDYSQAIVMPFVSDRTKTWLPMKIEKEEFNDLEKGYQYLTTNTCHCKECGLMYSRHRFNDYEMSLLYKNYRGEDYVELRSKYEPSYKKTQAYLDLQVQHLGQIETKVIEHLKNPPKNCTVLDFGGHDGLNSPFKNNSRQLIGYDISMEDPFVTISGPRYNSKQKFNIVTCMHVFEHVSWPNQLVKEISSYLDNDGLIYIEVPLDSFIDFNSGGLKEGCKKKHWHEHINSFSKKSIVHLFEENNFETLWVNILDVSDSFRKFEVIQFIGRKISRT